MLIVRIDEDMFIPLSYGEEKQVDLPAGAHTLIATMDWAVSLPLSISLLEGQSKKIIVDTKGAFSALVAIFVPPFTVFSLSETNF